MSLVSCGSFEKEDLHRMPSPLPAEAAHPAPVTPDGRYLVVRGRLWRRADPALPEAERERLVHALMTARRGVAAAKRTRDPEAEAAARAAVDLAKHGLGERGPVWWTDGAPDLNRHMARTTPYAEWYAAVAPSDRDGTAERTRPDRAAATRPRGFRA